MTDQPFDSVLAILPQASIASGRANTPAAGVLYQTSLMSALVEGVYDGDMTYGELHRHGDFGLGTFNALDGEMIGFDGVFYQLRSDGSARIVTDDQRTPFAVVTFFRPALSLHLAGSAKNEVVEALTAKSEQNIFTAIRLDGIFKRVVTRTVRNQHRPYPPLQDAAKGEKETVFENIEGTLAGFRTPAYAGTLGVPGYHLHFLNADRTSGGHVLDFVVDSATAELCPVYSLHVELPHTAAFEKAALNDPDLSTKISAAEG
ncbi:acetolactate decarboxylase [Sphingomonas faeni]|uniref:acetolactate decarboxylase n=1 Tax=Sphingomonas faeni TaxID=185950 RepID=UPI00278950B2|nr:acetolactate decarboxylase [Sphingomonas faeni]MDQ0839292.1 acetolactate decarboxylase [Sphingomonas faeni]